MLAVKDKEHCRAVSYSHTTRNGVGRGWGAHAAVGAEGDRGAGKLVSTLCDYPNSTQATCADAV